MERRSGLNYYDMERLFTECAQRNLKGEAQAIGQDISQFTYAICWNAFANWCQTQIESNKTVNLNDVGTLGFQQIGETLKMKYLKLSVSFLQPRGLQFQPSQLEKERVSNLVMEPTEKLSYKTIAKTANIEKVVLKNSINHMLQLIGDLLAEGDRVEIDLQEMGKFQSVAKLLTYSPLNKYEPSQIKQSGTSQNDMNEAASKAERCEKMFKKIQEELTNLQFIFQDEKKWSLCILDTNAVERIFSVLDDHILKIQALKIAQNSKVFEEQILNWEAKLMSTQSNLELWLKVQKTQLYLKPICSSEDLMLQMPMENRWFQDTEKALMTLIESIKEKPNVQVVMEREEVGTILKDANEKMEMIQNRLNKYLEAKMSLFPRFYFLSNDNLLDIFIQAKEPSSIQPYLSKCFSGITSLDFDQQKNIEGMGSCEDEHVSFSSKINPMANKGMVDVWLGQVEEAMKKSVKEIIEKSLQDYTQQDREKWITSWQGQAVLTVNQIFWTSQAEEAMKKDGVAGLQQYSEQLHKQLNQIVERVRGSISQQERQTLEALIVLSVHNYDVIKNLIERKVQDPLEFPWQNMLKSYWEGNDVWSKLMNTTHEYNYEYLGNSPRLAITPLTDRCFMSLCLAIHMNYGGSCQGPAGAGKTESTKDLSKALGRHCVVFNCSDQMDYLQTARLFKGMVSCGAWICFDEFNRICIEVLSIVQEQLQTIQEAVEQKLDKFEFEQTIIPLKPTQRCFITLNPGYAGRTELPDTLKAQFRSVSMMIPDYGLIAEIYLYSYGFTTAASLAAKIINVFKLASEQLSRQCHYDYGMRAVKSVLTVARNLKSNNDPQQENLFLLRAINDVVTPKLVPQDLPLFKGILFDFFPGMEPSQPNYGDLIVCVKNQIKKMNLQEEEGFITKVIQLYETIKARHGLLVAGPPCSGKTSIIKVLQGALTELHEKGLMNEMKTHINTLHPKGITIDQLYGQYDEVSKNFQDGVLAAWFRAQCQMPTKDRKWLILDGSIDPEWIESLNVLLDDNKKLILASGEVISLSENMNIIFEPTHQNNMTPATVSRCGVVYLESNEMSWRSIFNSWKNKLPSYFSEEHLKAVTDLAEVVFPPCIDFLRNDAREFSPTQDHNIITSCLKIWGKLLQIFNNQALQKDKEAMLTIIEQSFVYSAIWSLCATVTSEYRKTFDLHFKKVCKGEIEGIKKYQKNILHPIIEGATIYDYVYFPETNEWKAWMDLTDKAQMNVFPSGAQVQELIVDTVDTVRYSYMAEMFIKNAIPSLFVGPTGTGKSTYIDRVLNQKLDQLTYQTIKIGLTGSTHSNQMQEIIDGSIEKRAGLHFGGLSGKKSVIFVDDLNMPRKDKYNDQSCIEFLRQFLDYGGYYDLENTKHPFRYVDEASVIAAMCPGRNDICGRLLRHFNTVSVATFDETTMSSIFRTMLSWNFKENNFSPYVQELEQNIVEATLKIYNKCQEELTPTYTKTHYVFNFRDFSKVIYGMCQAKSDKISNKEVCIRLWAHETLRVFGDRLTNDEDKKWLLTNIKDVCSTSFQINFDQTFKHLDSDKDGKVETLEEMKGLNFGNLLTPFGMSERPYEEIQQRNQLQQVCEAALIHYNNVSTKPMELIFFSDAIDHLLRISRILQQPGGHALLVGVKGSGRQSLTRLASRMANLEVFQIETKQNYRMKEWTEDLKRLLRQSGGKGQPTVFLVSEVQIKEERFLEDINSILNGGDIPNLFREELPELMEIMKQAAIAEGKVLDGTQNQLYSYFIERCKRLLHIVLCFSPIGDSFMNRIRSYPSLANNMTIDWFSEWSNDALACVAKRHLAEIEMEHSVREACVEMALNIHNSSMKAAFNYQTELKRQHYIGSTSYMDFIDTFKAMFREKKDQIMIQKKRYEDGLNSLKTTEQQVLLQRLSEVSKESEKKTLIDNSAKIIEYLDEKKTLWNEEQRILEIALQNLTRDVLLYSGAITYFGAFTQAYRDSLSKEWIKNCIEKQIPSCGDFSLQDMLEHPMQIRNWINHGLPSNQYCIENAIISSKAKRWPLFIDPQGQANKWIRNLEKDRNLKILNFNDTNYLKVLENCIIMGVPVLIENVQEKLDSAIESLLKKQVVKTENTLTLMLGDHTIDYSPDFKLYMTTQLKNPQYLPEVQANVTLINFMITQESLTDQMLDVVVSSENIELKRMNDYLAIEVFNHKSTLKEIDNLMMTALQGTQKVSGDFSVVDTVTYSKALSHDISKKQEQVEQTKKQVESIRMAYSLIAEKAAGLFFCISNLARINPMYQYSLKFFIKMFVSALEKSQTNEVIEKRLQTLQDEFLSSLYQSISRSIFQNDQIIFSFLLACKWKEMSKSLDMEEFDFFLTGGIQVGAPPTSPVPWLTDKSWGELIRLGNLPRFQGFFNHFESNIQHYKQMYDSPNPHTFQLMPEYDNRFTSFQKMMLLKCLRPDKIQQAMHNYIKEQLGDKFTTRVLFDIADIYNESTNSTPIVFVLKQGARADPIQNLQKFAESKNKILQKIKLGQGREGFSEKLISEACQRSDTWVVLDNCHYARDWLPKLERICQNLSDNPNQTNKEFRLWLVTAAIDYFPASIIQNGIQVTSELPKGLKENLLQSYHMDVIASQKLFQSSTKPQQFRKLLYGLCFYNALILGRRSFGPLGFNIPYEFHECDLEVSVKQLAELINESPDKIPMDALKYFVGEVNIGGRVTDDKDRETVRIILEDFYTEKIFDDNYSFSESGKYKVPPFCEYEGYLEYMQNLPSQVEPEVFGLHSNADILKGQNETKAIISNILTTWTNLGVSKRNEQEFVMQFSDSILKALPASFNLRSTVEKFPFTYKESMNTVLNQELFRFNTLLNEITGSLKRLKCAIKGEGQMTPQLERILTDLQEGNVPPTWKSKTSLTLKPLTGFIQDVKQNVEFFENWIEKGMPSVVQINNFIFAQGLFTGALQNYARKINTELDALTFDFEIIQNENPPPPENGLYVSGMFLQGCKWNHEKGVLDESDEKVLFVKCPIVWFKPCKKEEVKNTPHYNCPVYRTSDRRGVLSTTGHSTNFVNRIRLPSDKPASHWTKRGVALVCSLDD